MNILYLANHLNIGGITRYVLTLTSGLKKKGHKVYLASSGGNLLPRFCQEGAGCIPIPIKTKSEISPKILLSLFKLSAIIGKYNIDIIHSNSRTTQVLGCFLSALFGIPHISTCHGFFKKRLLRRVFPFWGRKVIAVSSQVKEHLIKDFKVKEEDIRVIYSGVDTAGFDGQGQDARDRKKKELGLNGSLVIGIIARLSEEKGHIYLIRAMREVAACFPEVRLLIAGEGRMKGELLALTKSLDLEKNIFFTPAAVDTRETLSVMDIFVLPSLKEGLGLALMEAMSCGLCVIGSEAGGIKSLIQNGKNGVLVKPADTRALAIAILELLNNPKKRENLGQEAQIFIRQNFSQEKMVSKTEELYLECLGRKN